MLFGTWSSANQVPRAQHECLLQQGARGAAPGGDSQAGAAGVHIVTNCVHSAYLYHLDNNLVGVRRGGGQAAVGKGEGCLWCQQSRRRRRRPAAARRRERVAASRRAHAKHHACVCIAHPCLCPPHTLQPLPTSQQTMREAVYSVTSGGRFDPLSDANTWQACRALERDPPCTTCA